MIQINGKKTFELGVKIYPKKDRISIKGKILHPPKQLFHFAFNKPSQVITSMNDPAGRPCVLDYLQDMPVRLFPVGRLDWDSEGLLLLTNDGEFAQAVSHPNSNVTKTYLVKVNGQPTREQIAKLAHGVSIIGGKAQARSAQRLSRAVSRQYGWLRIVVSEGRNRQIRQMLSKIGFDVLKLKRVAIGKLRLGSLEKGRIFALSEKDLRKIFVPDPSVPEHNSAQGRR